MAEMFLRKTLPEVNVGHEFYTVKCIISILSPIANLVLNHNSPVKLAEKRDQ